jgi:cytidylate kinase
MGSVTISASYGAHGERIGRAVADRLGLPFLDRAIPSTVAQQLKLSGLSAGSLDERAPRRWERFLSSLSAPGPVDLLGEPSEGSDAFRFATEPAAEPNVRANDFRLATETVLRNAADTGGAVILGRAGMVVLKDRPDVLRVRLDGSVEARVAQTIANGTDEVTARETQRRTDGAREEYSTYFYKVSQDDVRLYHLIIDSLALPIDVCVDIVVRAAEARFAG